MAAKSRLIGAILVDNGLITGEQLARALQLQEQTGERLGEIVVAEFGVPRLELASVLAEQWAELERAERPAGAAPVRSAQAVEPLTPAEVQIRRPIGEIFVELGFINSDQLDAALDVQRESGARLGEVLIEQGSLSRLDLASALAEQWSPPQKLRPPAPVADPQPWQERVLAPVPAEQGRSADDRAAVALLEERLRVVERAAAATPWQEDLRLVASELRAAVSAVEQRLEAGLPGAAVGELAAALGAVGTRIDALESVSVPGELEALRQEIELLKTRPVTVEGMADLRAAVERLEARPDRADEISRLTLETAELATRVGEIADVGELMESLQALAGQAEAAQSGIEGLSRRVDDLAGLEGRLDEMAARLPGDDVIAAVPIRDLVPRIDDLSARVDEVAAAIPPAGTDGLATRIDSLEERSREGAGALERLVTELGELGSRTQERLDVLASREPDMVQVDELRARVEELAAAFARDESVGTLASRLSDIERRLAEATPAEDLRDEIRRAAESTAVERESLVQALAARVDELTAAAPRESELGELRSRLDELTARPAEDARVDDLEARLERLGVVESAIADLRESLNGIEVVRVGDALATGARLAALETALEAMAGLKPEGPKSDQADRVGVLAARLDETESKLAAAAELEERVAALAAELERRPDGDALAVVMAELRAELAVLADRPAVADPGERLLELSQRIDRAARDGHDRTLGLVEELNMRIGGLAEELGQRVDDLAGRADGLVAREEAAAMGARVQAELDGLRESADARAAAVDAALSGIDHARATGHQELEKRIGEDVGAIRAALELQAVELSSQLRGHGEETAALRARVDELQDAAARGAALEARLERMIDERLEGLAGRISDEVAGARAEAEEAAAALRGETGSLGARLDEMLGLRHADMQTARAASEQLEERVAALAALRADDLAAAELAGAELAARLDDVAVRSAAAAFEAEQALREDLAGLAAQLEERDASGIEAREELRSELERAASSVGWRLERIEESLAADDTTELKEKVAELERRLEGQVAIGEEQVRTTERALRKGLASLGERLVDSESAYVDAGNALRRSIERLGAAVVEADARMADQIPVSDAEGCVAFAPTAAGYRLVELPGRPPEIGSTVELDVSDAPLVVTRYGRSPLPLDSRPCAYLDRAQA